jgi:hypothetical protein
VATVRASCPTCGDIETTSDAVWVLRYSTTGASSYAFVCPSCRLRVTKPATDAVIALLVDAGSRCVSWGLPAELTEPKTGAPVTHDDLLAFHLALTRPGWLESEVDRLRAVERKRS